MNSDLIRPGTVLCVALMQVGAQIGGAVLLTLYIGWDWTLFWGIWFSLWVLTPHVKVPK